nr:amidase [Alteromonas macleodii]
MKRREFFKRATIVTTTAFSTLAVRASIANNSAETPSMNDQITALSASALSRAIREREISCKEVMTAYLERIHRFNPTYNAIVSLANDDTLLEQARAADKALSKGEYWGWMHGMPHAVKDLADVRGFISSYGSPLFSGTIATRDSLPVERIRNAGAIFIGKTNTPEFGLGSQTYNPVFGTTRNAYNPLLCAGGSSGGAAVGLAANLLPVADGSDMMGSLRNPAGFNNVIGFRPTKGRVPGADQDAKLFFNQLATDGPMGRNVTDTIKLLTTMAGYDAREPLSLRDSLPQAEAFLPAPLNDQLRIGFLGDYGGHLRTEQGLLDLCRGALRQLEKHGVVIEDCTPRFEPTRLWETWLTLRHFAFVDSQALLKNPSIKSQLKPELQWEIEGSLDMTAARVVDADKARSDWYRALLALFEDFDFLVLPTAQVFPFAAATHWPTEINGEKMDTYHRWMEIVIGGTLAGLPVVNLPAGFDQQGRPMGIQVMGPAGADTAVLEFALAYESATSFLARRPKLVTKV